MRATSFLIVVVLSYLAACVTPDVPLASPDADAQGKMLAPPAPGMAVLYIAHVDSFSGTPALNVSVAARQIGGLTNNTWFRVELPPGTYDVRATGRDGSGAFDASLRAGDARFLVVRYARMTLTGQVAEVPANDGRQIVLAGRRARAI